MEADRRLSPNYLHTPRAGNAGDVWKHLLLAEALDEMLAESCRDSKIYYVENYVESHAGFPWYILEPGGSWEMGVGRCWDRIDPLTEFIYFSILRKLNQERLLVYPGSTSLALAVADLNLKPLPVKVWDKNPQVCRAWNSRNRGLSESKMAVEFHLGDGFTGVRELISSGGEALLLIDPPYTQEDDFDAAEKLFSRGADAGWTVLCWYMGGGQRTPRFQGRYTLFLLDFEEVGMAYGRWRGAVIALSTPHGSVEKRLGRASDRFREVMDR